MNFELKPLLAIGELNFGELRSFVRSTLSEFEKERENGTLNIRNMPSDLYPTLGWTIHYSKYDTFGAMEFDARSKVMYNSKNLFELSWNELKSTLLSQDPHTRVSDDHIISHQLGISATKHPSTDEIDSICVFEKDFFTINKGLPHPSSLTSFRIQVGFIEEVEPSKKEYETLEEAASELFLPTREKGFLLWNTIPVSFDYREDFHILLAKIMSTIWSIYYSERGDALCTFKTKNLDFAWRIQWNPETFYIDSEWRKVNGGLEKMLNSDAISRIYTSRQEFLAEWKLPMAQLYQAVKSKGITFVDIDAQEVFLQVESLLESINQRGIFYNDFEAARIAEKKKRKTGIKQVLIYVGILIVGLLSWYLLQLWNE
jgi:hypothetical protein